MVPYGQIARIRAIQGVKDVVLETQYEPAVASVSETADPNMATSSEMIGSSAAYAAGYTGAGSRVAVIDTGIDTDHQSFDAGGVCVFSAQAGGKSRHERRSVSCQIGSAGHRGNCRKAE